ncbi:MAG: bactofilin family protein [Candidatus Wenzhouxiangella sp. M2_3B_020]
MAIFGKDRAQQAAGHGTTIVAAGTQFVGDLTLSDNLHVDGRVDGDVQSEANVVIGSDGAIQGRITAAAVVVSGRVDGSVSAQRLEIVAGGSMEGDVHVVDLVIEPGGRFNGSSEIVARQSEAAVTESKRQSSDTGAKPAGKKPGGSKAATGSGEEVSAT